ncbi:MAG: hypothetical protein COB67_00490 [SAR324 cluster bacterium]|uniref:Tyr recombinase domain-containing protein n=1 Tax=SAR324 cluster bacterium TaxID=2024889 RepID=A0A2A4TBH3_9DELT|nr:MAG: hypothetical protein COB67_00490 [SAR324 cluster bacterium]
MRTLGENVKRNHFNKNVKLNFPIEPKKGVLSNVNFWISTYINYKQDIEKLASSTIQNYKDSLKYIKDFIKNSPASCKSFKEIDHNFFNAFIDAYLLHLMLDDDNVVFLDDMSEYEIEELYQIHGQKHYSTVNQRITVLKQWFTFISNYNTDGVNFKAWYDHIVKYPVPKKQDIAHEHFNEAEEKLSIEALFKWPNNFKQTLKRSNRYYALRDATAVLLMIVSGTRAKESTQFKLKDISYTNDEITIRMHGKGNKERDISIDIEYNPEIVSMLRELIELAKNNPDAYILKTSSGKPVSDRNIFKFARSFFKLNNISDTVFLHKLRHTYGTLYVSRGGSLVTLQSNMGHENQVTTGIYAKSTGNVKREERKQIGKKRLEEDS